MSAARSARRSATVSVEERAETQTVDHLRGVEIAQRGQMEGHIAQKFDPSTPPMPHRISGPNVGSTTTPTRASRPPWILALEDDVLESETGAGHTRPHGLDRRSNLLAAAAQIQDDTAHIGLVNEARRHRLRHQGETHGRGHSGGLLRRSDLNLRHGDARDRKQRAHVIGLERGPMGRD